VSTLTYIAWNSHDTRLLVACAVGLAAIIVLIGALRIAPFLSILLGTFVAGFGAGLPLETVTGAFSKGAGGILGDVGIVIALGAMLGALMSESGAADRLVGKMLERAHGAALPWMMAVVAVIIGLPLFFEVGLVVMAPVIFAMARRSGQPLMRIAIPALAGMTTLHALLPPHPGPLIAIGALHADLGVTLGLGLIAALPAVVLAGPLYGRWLAPRLGPIAPAGVGELFVRSGSDASAPGFAVSLLTILLPVVLMLGRTVARLWIAHDRPIYTMLDFLGEPIVALTITVLVAIVALGWMRGAGTARVGETLRKSAPPIAGLLLTIGAGGSLKQALVVAGVSGTIGKVATEAHLPMLLLVWLIAVALRQATGSATVATTTTAGIVAPLAAQLPGVQTSLLALSIGAGSVFFCHVNDAGFWMVREYFGLKLRQTLWVWSVLQTIVSVTGLAMVLLMSAVLR
jgi:GntP family gluconate:H+ symporter